MLDSYNQTLSKWVDKEKAALSFIHSVGTLLYNSSVELVLFRNTLIDTSVSEVLHLHKYAREIVGKPIDIFTTASLAEEMLKLKFKPSKIDIGKLTDEWINEKENFNDKSSFLSEKLVGSLQTDAQALKPKDVILYGFGRIGRLAARELIKQFGKGDQLRLKAIVLRKLNEDQLRKRADLLRMDSVHGRFPGTVEVDIENSNFIINGQIVKLIAASSPDTIDYESFGISDALVIDNTGAFRDAETLGLHLKSKGVSQVVLTAPGKGIPNIVFGVNQSVIDIEEDRIVSAASCTTNAIVPILKTIEDKFGIVKGHIESIHAYTNDQNLLDNYHKKHRRGRSAAINMVITETGAGKAVAKVIPELGGKLTANAVRVPTPNGSLAIMNLTIPRTTTVEEVNETLKSAALQGDLVDQIRYSIESELVSNDIIGSNCCSVFDSEATLVSPDQKSIVLYVWYDNEYGYTKQVIRLAKYISKVRRQLYY